MKRLTMLTAIAILALAACSGEAEEQRSEAPPVDLSAGEAACAVHYGDDPEMIVGPVLYRGEATSFTSDDTAVTVKAGEVVEVRVVGANGEDYGDYGLGDADETGVTFYRDASLSGEMPGYSMTCWRG